MMKRKLQCSTWHCSRPAQIGVQALKKSYCAVCWNLFMSMPGGYAPLSKDEVKKI